MFPSTTPARQGLTAVATRPTVKVLRLLMQLLLKVSFAQVRAITSQRAVENLLGQPVRYELRVGSNGTTSNTTEVIGSWSSLLGLKLATALPGLPTYSSVHGACQLELTRHGELASQRRAWVLVRQLQRFTAKGKPRERITYLLVSGEHVLQG